MIWVFVLLGIILAIVLIKGKKPSEPTAPTAPMGPGEEFAELKKKVKNMEKYRMRERYTSPNDNNGLTIAGTILEQFLDISIEVFNQTLVKEMLDKLINDSGDAQVVVSVIEDIGGAIKESIKKNDLLECLTKMDCSMEKEVLGEDLARITTKCRVGDTDEFREVPPNSELNGDEWKSGNTENCDRYALKGDSFENIFIDIRNKVADMLMDPEKQKLYYDTFVQIGKNNINFMRDHNIRINARMKQDDYPNPFDEGGEFFEYMPRDHAIGEMQNMGTAFKNGKMYIPKNVSK